MSDLLGGKASPYAALVAARKQCRACSGLVNPSVCAGGVYDSDHIGPWSLWQGTLNADLMLVGQDWGDVAYLVNIRGHEAARNPTERIAAYAPRQYRQSHCATPLPFTPSTAGGALSLMMRLLLNRFAPRRKRAG